MPPESQRSSRFNRKLIFIVTGAFILGLVVVILVINKRQSVVQPKPQVNVSTSTEFRVSAGQSAPQYGSSEIYDPCNLLTMDVIKANVSGYKEGLATLQTDKRQPKPYIIDHHYIDRSILQALGKDGEPRPVRQTATFDGVEAAVRTSSFISPFDSHCIYREDSAIFAKLYIIQPPTPLNPALLDYAEGRQTKRETGDVTFYVGEREDNGPYNVVMIHHKKQIAVIMQSANPTLLELAGDEIAGALTKPPKGSFELHYPSPFDKLVNPCSLLTAEEFIRYTNKPASALAEEQMTLTETSKGSVERGCLRQEVDRFTNDVASSSVAVNRWPSEDGAKHFIERLKANEEAIYKEIIPTKEKIGDESYVTVSSSGGFLMEVRVGSSIISVGVALDRPTDTSAGVYEARMTPIAKQVIKRYKE